MQIDSQQGVLITQVIVAQVHMGLGHTDQVKAIIRRNKEGQAQGQSVPAYRLE